MESLELDEIWEQKDRNGYGMGYPNPFLAMGLDTPDHDGMVKIKLRMLWVEKRNESGRVVE